MMKQRRRRYRGRVDAAALATLLAIAACTGSRPDVDGATPTSSTTAATSSTAWFSPSTGSSSSTTTGEGTTAGDDDPDPSPGGGCSGNDAVPPAGASDVTEAAADVDGDGRDDRVVAYRRADDTRRVGVDLAAGGTAAVDAGDAAALDGPVPLRVLGGAPLGGDGETIVAVTSSGASVVVVGLFQFVECSLSRVTYPSGQTVALPVGGAITHGDGVACTNGELVTLSAMSSDGQSFTTEDTTYRVDGNTLVEVGSDSGTLSRPGDAAALDRYYTLDCPSLERGLGG